jgi:adenine-specific DNA-methyltransferase
MTQPTTPRQHFEAQLAILIAKFNQHRSHYLSTAYNETDVRAEFIDPLFEALGWDVSNRAGHGPHEKEVIREKSEVSGRSDYQFQLNGRVMFIVEAKAPHVPLDRTDVIMQAKKYAWNSKETSIAAITDFEEFRLYDATVKPDPKHPEVGLIFATKYTEYLKPKTLDDLWLLSKEAVAAGSIERLLKMSSVKQRERLPVDVAFLDDLTAWREKLAKAVFKIEPEIDPADLNSVVQVFLDRLIFIRFAEDHGILAKRGLEDVARLWERSGKQRSIVNDLNALFHEVNDLLNGEIFKPHKCEKIDWDAEAALVAKIIQALYDGPYRFDVIGVELLGSIYERYLGKTIRVTATRAMVEDKPEVRKAGGVYYTPKYIVEYIVAQTVGKLIEGKTPTQIARLKILDPACGSGSFLLGAYQALIEYHERYYSGKAAKRTLSPTLSLEGRGSRAAAGEGETQLSLIDAGEGGEYRLPLTEKAAILKNNLFGVDIDPQAVEITMMSLYIKMLEGERGAIMDRRVLPPLRDNIKCGNSLIGYDIRDVGAKHDSPITDDDLDRIRPFDWHSKGEGFGDIMQAGGFDAVIGNPPYGATLTDMEISYILAKFSIQDYQLDTYMLFIEKSITLLRRYGLLGVIVPNTWLLNLQSKRFRKHVFDMTQLENLVHYRRPVFPGVTVDTEVFVLRKAVPAVEHQIAITIIDKDNAETHYSISQKRWQLREGEPVNILERPELIAIADKMKTMPILDEICIITQGSKPFQVGKGKPPQTRKIVDEKPYVSERKHDRTFRPLLRGSLIQKYMVIWNEDYWISFGDWLAEPRYSANYDAPEKIVIRQTGDSLVATLDRKQFIARDNLYTIIGRDSKLSLSFILGLLNSRPLNWFYQNIINPEKGEALAQVKRGHLAQLPIRTINFDDPADKAKHDRMVNLVQRMLDLHKQQQAASSDATRERLQREINVTDEQIDALVYELYGLTAEEIAIVKGK